MFISRVIISILLIFYTFFFNINTSTKKPKFNSVTINKLVNNTKDNSNQNKELGNSVNNSGDKISKSITNSEKINFSKGNNLSNDLNSELVFKAGSIVLLFLIILIIYKKLIFEKIDKEKLLKLDRLKKIGLLTIVLVILLIVAFTWIMLKKLKDNELEKAKNEMIFNLYSTSSNLNQWVNKNMLDLENVVNQEDFKVTINQLIKFTKSKKKLKINTKLRKLRADIFKHMPESDSDKIIVIDKNYRIIVSNRETEIGEINSLYKQKRELVEKVFNNETKFIPTIYYDSSKKNRVPMMFYVVPIKIKNEVVAVLIKQEDPLIDYSRICSKGIISRTSDTYAFDDSGMMITKARFEKDLKELAIFKNEQSNILKIKDFQFSSSILSIEKKKNDLSGYKYELIKDNNIDGFINMNGYEDYRGVLVYGAWLWNGKLNYGLITEIDVNDALSTYFITRNIILFIIGSITILLAGMVLVIIIISERANNELISLNEDLENRVYERAMQLNKSNLELMKLSQAVEQSPSAIVITDKTGKIEYVNPSFTELTGYKPKEVMGKNSRLLKADYFSDSYFRDLWNTISSKKIWHGEMYNRKKNGEFYWEYASIAPIINNYGVITHYVSVKNDITEQKKFEKALEDSKEKAEAATKIKSEFLANMSHEIRTPMNAIIGLTNLLMKTDLSSKQNDYINKIDIAAENLLGIINDILDFSKIEAGKLKIEYIEFELQDVLNNISNVICSKSFKKGLEFTILKDPTIPDYLIGDPLRLGQILLNLTNNAVKFTEKGKVELSIKSINSGSDYVTIKVSVRDTGIGLSTEEMEKLFKAFTQADTSITRKYGGTGLGLSITKQLVNLMGGNIRVKSRLGEGSEFYFSIKLKISPKMGTVKKIVPNEIKNLHILIYEDNPTCEKILNEYLAMLKIKTEFVTSFDNLNNLLTIDKKRFDILILDYEVEGNNGIKMIKKINSVISQDQIGKFIMILPEYNEELTKELNNENVDIILVKPITETALFNAITTIPTVSNHYINNNQNNNVRYPENFEQIRGAKILLVEDNEINRQVAKETLEGEGFWIDLATNGQEALDKLINGNDYDLILMDLQMPVMDGYKASESIRKKLGLSVPIVALSADAMTGVAEKAKKSGMNDYVSKPIDFYKLYEVFTKLIKLKDRKIKAKSSIDSSNVIYKELLQKLNENDEFDIDSALLRLQGNMKLLCEVLKKYSLKSKKVINNLKAAIEINDMESAIRIAHTMKGLSGNVGLEFLRQRYEIIEKKLKNNQLDLALIEEITPYIKIITDKIDNIIKIDSLIKQDIKIDLTEIKAKIVETIRYLKDYDSKASDSFKTIEGYLLNSEHRYLAEKISIMIEKYDFEGAFVLCNDLMMLL